MAVCVRRGWAQMPATVCTATPACTCPSTHGTSAGTCLPVPSVQSTCLTPTSPTGCDCVHLTQAGSIATEASQRLTLQAELAMQR